MTTSAEIDRTATHDTGHVCTCQGTDRKLAVVVTDDAMPLDDLVAAAGAFGWAFDESLGVVEVAIGPRQRFKTLSEAVAILKTCTREHFASLKAVWLGPTDRVDEHLRCLVRARPLNEMAREEGDSPLAALLDEGSIQTWFQPVFTVENLDLWGYECLMRGEIDGEVVMPGKLLDWAADEGLVFTLDRVCREAHLKNAARAAVPEHCRFLINFLPSVIYDPEVCLRSTMRAAKASGIAPERVIFEVVETEAVEDPAFLRRILDRYRKWGFGVALDDVGAGHSGLTMLADLEPDLIKIDRGLISRAPDSVVHRSICETLVNLGHEMGKAVLAEGVESEAEWALVKALKADLVQGFGFGRPAPVPATEAVADLK